MTQRLTPQQKRHRRYARENARKALIAINASIHPVFDGDEAQWEQLAVGYARATYRHMQQAEKGDAK